ncbi:MAG: NAD(P)/FAD-dependent oxidoreductase [Sandaracinaceae bacterium]|nr:NAD(P)/FAD-dependent oxidoreductase [Sandaracinaceae bacterium]
MHTEVDLIVVGAGPAGLEAALLAARARLRVRVVDLGRDDASLRRNGRAVLAEGTVGLDHVAPSEVRARARESLERHGVHVELGEVTDVGRRDDGVLAVTIADGARSEVVTTRRVLLASGLVDVLPPLPGLAETWGVSSFSCPYCHGYERSGEAARTGRWGVLAHEVGALKTAPLYTRWAREVVLFTDGLEPPRELRAAHEAADLRYETAVVRALRHDEDRLEAVVLEGDREVALDVLVHRPPRTRGALIERLGLAVDPQGLVVVDGRTETSMKGVHACGDLTTTPHQIVFALADGAHAAMAIASSIAFEDTLGRR